MPRTFGDSIIHQSHFDFATCIDEPLPSHGHKQQTEQETRIGQLIAGGFDCNSLMKDLLRPVELKNI